MEMDYEYILKNGMLESYILGELNEEEVQAVEAALKNDSNLRSKLDEIEGSFEQLALENSIEPRPEIKSSLMKSIIPTEKASDHDPITPVITMNRRRNYSFMIAASMAAFLLLNSIWLYTKWQGSESELEQLQVETNSLKEQMNQIEGRLAETSNLYESLNSPDVEKHIMKGNSLSPTSVAIAYVNDESKSVILNCRGLANLGDGETYQMWADVEGEMIDMGVIPKGTDMVELAYIDNAESLNITIEPAGGNDHPTVERLITNVIL